MNNLFINMQFFILGIPFCLGAKITGCETAPSLLKDLYVKKLQIDWHNLLLDTPQIIDRNKDQLKAVEEMAIKTATQIAKSSKKPIVIGGDHTIAIGTWSGVINKLQCPENFGLIWIDAHMDSHTYESSHSKSYHGMPISFLLGQGKDELSNIGGVRPKINPKHLVIIGARSFEDEEKAFLEQNKVRIMYMDEVHSRGFQDCFNEAITIAHGGERNFGISLDLDYFSTDIAPGVGSPEPNGGTYESLAASLKGILNNKFLAAFEIVEYNPILDKDKMTAELVFKLINDIIS